MHDYMSYMQGGKVKSPKRSALLSNRVCCYWGTEQKFWCSFIPAWEIWSKISATIHSIEAASISSDSRVVGAREHRQFLLGSELRFKAEAGQWFMCHRLCKAAHWCLWVKAGAWNQQQGLISICNVCVRKQHPCPSNPKNLVYNPDF